MNLVYLSEIRITPLKVDGCGEQDRNHDDQTCIKN
jgi:hypothetical protein